MKINCTNKRISSLKTTERSSLRIGDIRDEFGGEPPKFLYFWYPPPPLFYCIFKKEFSKIFKISTFDACIFFEKFPKISKKFVKFFQIFQNRKNSIIFELKLVQNHYIDKNLVKFPPKVQKTANFSLKTAMFSKIFGAFGAENLYFWYSKNPFFLELGSPLKPWSSPNSCLGDIIN